MKPMKNLLLMGLLSALGAGGALAAERSHFTHFITRDGATLKDGDKVFRFAGIHAPELYDNMIAEADKQGLRLILPFIDHWWWWGGREQLAAFYHEKAEDFYRGPIARPSKPIWM